MLAAPKAWRCELGITDGRRQISNIAGMEQPSKPCDLEQIFGGKDEQGGEDMKGISCGPAAYSANEPAILAEGDNLIARELPWHYPVAFLRQGELLTFPF